MPVRSVSVALVVVLVMGMGFSAAGCAAAQSSNTSTASDSDSTTETVVVEERISREWQGSWFSKSEILPPEVETDAYELIIAADGSFVLNENGTQLYTGIITDTNEPDVNWGDATIDRKTIKVQLVNAQGIYKLVFNAGDDWNPAFKKIIFQR